MELVFLGKLNYSSTRASRVQSEPDTQWQKVREGSLTNEEMLKEQQSQSRLKNAVVSTWIMVGMTAGISYHAQQKAEVKGDKVDKATNKR